MSTIYCMGCEKEHDRTPVIRHMKDRKTGTHGWFCDKWFAEGKPPEFIPDSIKQGRKEHHDALLQPYREGQFSKEYRDAYPDISKKMVEAGAITKEQHDNARPVWKGDEL